MQYHEIFHRLLTCIYFAQINKKSIDYIPFQRAMVLKGKGAEDDELKEELEELEQTVKANFSNINQRFEVIGVSTLIPPRGSDYVH